MTEQLEETIKRNARSSLHEDLGSGDLTAALVPAAANARAIVISREPMTMAGQPWVDEVYRQLDPKIKIQWIVNDGERASADSEICILNGPARSLLTGERAALNFLQMLSGTATVTAQYVEAVAGTQAKILDTRKTIPGLRLAQKYAVRCGGGGNHRMGLFDAILIKENHIISAGNIAAAVDSAKNQHTNLPVEIEVESIDELKQALAVGVDRVLLDNFDLEDLRRAVAVNQQQSTPPAELESSGGITLNTIKSVARTGVDYISVGALTKNVKAIDLSMRIRYSNR